jgi:ammonia channel protein AmtB
LGEKIPARTSRAVALFILPPARPASAAAAGAGARLQNDRAHFPPNSLLVTLIGAGIRWLGWNGFNGGDPYFANADAVRRCSTIEAYRAAVLAWRTSTGHWNAHARNFLPQLPQLPR